MNFRIRSHQITYVTYEFCSFILYVTSNKTKITNANVCDEFYMAHI